jgi:hypothetical protein
MRIDPASPGAVRFVAERLRERDVVEFAATSFAGTREQLADDLVRRYAGLSGAICASDASGPVAVGATIEARPNVLTLLFFATDAFPGIALGLTRFIRQRLFPAQRAAGVHRIECVSVVTHTDAHKWIEILGLEREATMPGYGRAGEAFYQFAWTAPHVR